MEFIKLENIKAHPDEDGMFLDDAAEIIRAIEALKEKISDKDYWVIEFIKDWCFDEYGQFEQEYVNNEAKTLGKSYIRAVLENDEPMLEIIKQFATRRKEGANGADHS